MADIEDLDVHLATCSECAGELADYRGLLSRMDSLRHHAEATPPGFTAGIVSFVASADKGWAEKILRLVHDQRAHVAAASLGGAVLGAAAIGLIWWRAARRDVVGAA